MKKIYADLPIYILLSKFCIDIVLMDFHEG